MSNKLRTKMLRHVTSTGIRQTSCELDGEKWKSVSGNHSRSYHWRVPKFYFPSHSSRSNYYGAQNKRSRQHLILIRWNEKSENNFVRIENPSGGLFRPMRSTWWWCPNLCYKFTSTFSGDFFRVVICMQTQINAGR